MMKKYMKNVRSLYFPGILAQCDFCTYVFQHFKAPVPKTVSKKARNFGSRNLKHYFGISENTLKHREFVGDSCL